MSESLKATDALGADGALKPRVTLQHMQEKIKHKFFVTGSDAICMETVPEMDILTICFLVMDNGFIIIGKSAPASPENYVQEKGETFAYEDAIRQLWPLEGYHLRQELHNNDHAER